MLKKVFFTAIATGLIATVALPVQFTGTADAATVTCKAAAKAKFPKDLKARHAFRKACKDAWRKSQK